MHNVIWFWRFWDRTFNVNYAQVRPVTTDVDEDIDQISENPQMWNYAAELNISVKTGCCVAVLLLHQYNVRQRTSFKTHQKLVGL